MDEAGGKSFGGQLVPKLKVVRDSRRLPFVSKPYLRAINMVSTWFRRTSLGVGEEKEESLIGGTVSLA